MRWTKMPVRRAVYTPIPKTHRVVAPTTHGTWDTDQPPILGIVGRDSGQIQLSLKNSARSDLEPPVLPETQKGTTINTDEWGAYRHLSAAERQHVTVCHAPGKRVWARDEDGDGIREVHTNTIEGVWTGVRNFLRPFRGVNKLYLQPLLSDKTFVFVA